jgi:hypothetical protein
MPPPDAAVGTDQGGPSQRGTDLLEHLTTFLSTSSPHVLLVTGQPGTGKSSLVAALRRRLGGPWLLLAYRDVPSAPAGSLGSGDPGTGASLLLLEPERTPPGDGAPGATAPPTSVASSPAPALKGNGLPESLRNAVGRLAATENGRIVVDRWDRETEARLGEGGARAAPVEVSAGAHWLRDLLGTPPVHAVVSLPGEPDPYLQTLADGIIDLGWEDQDGCRIRVASVAQLKWKPLRESRFTFSLADGHFFCPPRLPAGFRVPLGAPAPDPGPVEGAQWPGSEAFATAFGRLRDRTMTGVEMSPALSLRYMDVLALPAAAHALRSGGRVLWLPAPQDPPSIVYNELTRLVPVEWVRERLRILSGSAYDPSAEGLRGVVLTPRVQAAEDSERGSPAPGGAAPYFPEAHQFLRQGSAAVPSLFVLSLDGLRALASLKGVSYQPSVFPLVLAGYLRLPRFHGMGFGRSDDPLAQAALPSVEIHLRMQQRCGRTVIFGVRPETPGYLLDWTEPAGRYSLVPML